MTFEKPEGVGCQLYDPVIVLIKLLAGSVLKNKLSLGFIRIPFLVCF